MSNNSQAQVPITLPKPQLPKQGQAMQPGQSISPASQAQHSAQLNQAKNFNQTINAQAVNKNNSVPLASASSLRDQVNKSEGIGLPIKSNLTTPLANTGRLPGIKGGAAAEIGPTSKPQPAPSPAPAHHLNVQSSLPKAKSPVASSAPPPPGNIKASNPLLLKKTPVMAKTANPLIKVLPFILGGIAIIGVVIFIINQVLGGGSPNQTINNPDKAAVNKKTEPVTLVYWGLWESEEIMSEVIADFVKNNPQVTIDYKKQSHKDYKDRLQTAIASGNGPDIFRFHASWVPILIDELSPAPSKIIKVEDFKKTFYPVASEQLVLNDQIFGLPLMYDGLALFYNKDILETAGVNPPSSWPELQTMAKELTVPANRSSTDDIKRAGLAIGNASNVDHFSDILGLLILQNEGDPNQPNSKKVKEALSYYASFITKDKVWSDLLPNSTLAFAREEVAMIFAPSWRIHEILSLNADLNFGVAPVPELGGQKIAWASYWAEGVSNKSHNQDTAWEFLKYLSQKEVMQKLYSTQSQIRVFGEIYSRVDLAADLVDPEYLQAFLNDAPYAKNWYLNSYTHDASLNDTIIKYYEEAVTKMAKGEDADGIAGTLEAGVKQTLRQYNLSK